MTTDNLKKIYLAGPTVFDPDAVRLYDNLIALCKAKGLSGVSPADATSPPGQEAATGRVASRLIFSRNMRKLQSSQGVLATLSPFRGELEPDSGTVFEVGAAYAMGLPIAAVIGPAGAESWGARIRRACGGSQVYPNGLEYDNRYAQLVEDFGGQLNLMLAESCKFFDSYEEALDWLARA